MEKKFCSKYRSKRKLFNFKKEVSEENDIFVWSDVRNAFQSLNY